MKSIHKGSQFGFISHPHLLFDICYPIILFNISNSSPSDEPVQRYDIIYF